MDTLLSLVSAEKVMKALNRTEAIPYDFSDTWNPQSSNWHSMINHEDAGSANPLIFPNMDVFVGRIEVVNEFTEFLYSVVPYFLILNSQGMEIMSKYGNFSEHRELTDLGFAVNGVFGGVKILNHVNDLTWRLNYSGYLIKRA